MSYTAPETRKIAFFSFKGPKYKKHKMCKNWSFEAKMQFLHIKTRFLNEFYLKAYFKFKCAPKLLKICFGEILWLFSTRIWELLLKRTFCLERRSTQTQRPSIALEKRYLFI